MLKLLKMYRSRDLLFNYPFRLFFPSYRHKCFPKLDDACLDWEYFFDPKNNEEILENIECRTPNTSPSFHEVLVKIQNLSRTEKSALVSGHCDGNLRSLREKILWMPNKTCPDVLANKSGEPRILEKVGTLPDFHFKPSSFDMMTKRLNLVRTQFLGHISGSKGYYLKSHMAAMERALIKYTLETLLKNGFILISVPDIVSKSVFECCGMKTEDQHSLVFHLDENWGKNMCLSGTAEMALAAYAANRTFRHDELPLKLCAVSRCYRAEAKRSQTEKGIYRVHHFTKVEMFGVTADGNQSQELLNKFINIQKVLFSDLGLHFQLAEMPPGDLGVPAYHKIDIEAWMPGRKMYGEISSASNCTDYQSRRLNIRYSKSSDDTRFCHTINGTACAVPRMLIAIFESFQNFNGSISIPEPLQKYMNISTIKEKFLESMASMKPV